MKSGIYKITNLINNKVYIGSSKNLNNRLNKHKSDLNRNIHYNKHLQSSYNKYGSNNFKFEIIRFVNNINLLIRFEQCYINKYKCCDRTKGFNKREKADSNIGNKISKEGRLNMSIAKKKLNLKMHPNTKKALNSCYNPRNNGKLQSLEQRTKRSLLMKEIWKNKTIEEKENLSNKLSKLFKGKKRPDAKFSNEAREKSKLSKLKPIIQYDINMNYIREWNSIKECCETLGLQGSLINKTIKGERANTKGFKFKYKFEANNIGKQGELLETPTFERQK